MPAGNVNWRTKLIGSYPFAGTPSVSPSGIVYCGSAGGLNAVSAATGGVIWTLELPASVSAAAAIGSDGTVFFGDYVLGSQGGNYSFHAVNGKTGESVWSTPVGSSVWASAAIGGDNTVYVGTSGEYVYAFDGSTGSVKWTYQCSSYVYASPAIGSCSLLLSVAVCAAFVSMLVWMRVTHACVCAAANGLVFIGSGGNSVLYALE